MSTNTYYSVNRPQVIAEKFEDEYVIVNLISGAYYGLAGTGASIWELIEGGATHAEITTNLGEQFDAAPEEIARAVTSLLSELERETLITPHTVDALNPRNIKPPVRVPPTRGTFVAPILEKHLDMQEVLQLDPIHEVDETGWPARLEQ